MVDIKLLIEVNPNESAESIDSIHSENTDFSNVSVQANLQGNLVSIPREESSSNGLVWADEDYLVFNSEDYLDNVENSNAVLESEENPIQLVWGIVPNSKEYRVKLTISGSATLKDIIVYGDRVVNQFPTEAILDGTQVVYSDDPVWALAFENENLEHTIEFTKWNRANYNAVISGISVLNQYIEVKNSMVKEFNSLSEIQSGDNISYDIIPNYGDFSIIDRDGEIKDAINSKIITDSNIGIKLYINDKLVRTHNTTSSEYDPFGNLFKVSTSDLLEVIGDKDVYGFVDTGENNLFLVVYSVLARFGYSYEDVVKAFQHSTFYNGDAIYGTIKSLMEKTTIKYPAFEKTTLRDFLSQLCETLQIGGRLNKDNKLEFFSLRPKVPQSSPVIAIPLKHQFSKPTANMFPIDVYKKIVVSGSTTQVTTDAENYNSMELFKVSDGSYYKKVQTEYLYGNTSSSKEYQTASNNIFMDDTNLLELESGTHTIIKEFAENMLSDYSNGNDVVTLKVSFNDYYDTNGNRVVDSALGQFIDVGSIVRIDKNNNGVSRFTEQDGSPKLWKVVSSEIIKVGVPFVQLSLRRVKQITTPQKVEPLYVKTKPSLTTTVEYTINCPTEGASIVQYTDDTYSQIEYVYKDGDVFFTKGLSVVNITAYFKAKKDGMQDSEPFIFRYGNSSGGDDIIKPL